MDLLLPFEGDKERGCMTASLQQRVSFWISVVLAAIGACYWVKKIVLLRSR